MTRIGEHQGALESFVEIGQHSPLEGLPERYLLRPDGRSIEAHIENLYPANLSEKQLFDFACPQEAFCDLLRPHAFRQVLSELRYTLSNSCKPAAVAASRLLRERGEDEHLLRMALHLLHKA